MVRLWALIVFKLSLVLASSGDFQTGRISLDATGLRVGFSAFNSGPEFHQVDIFAGANLPCRLPLGSAWDIRCLAEGAVGWLSDPGHDAFVTSFGPVGRLARKGFPVTLSGGVVPAYLSRYDFGSKNLGSNVQFTSHFAVAFEMGRSVRLLYRFQHMSNGGLGSPNPGLNLHMLCVAYEF